MDICSGWGASGSSVYLGKDNNPSRCGERPYAPSSNSYPAQESQKTPKKVDTLIPWDRSQASPSRKSLVNTRNHEASILSSAWKIQTGIDILELELGKERERLVVLPFFKDEINLAIFFLPCS